MLKCWVPCVVYIMGIKSLALFLSLPVKIDLIFKALLEQPLFTPFDKFSILIDCEWSHFSLFKIFGKLGRNLLRQFALKKGQLVRQKMMSTPSLLFQYLLEKATYIFM